MATRRAGKARARKRKRAAKPSRLLDTLGADLDAGASVFEYLFVKEACALARTSRFVRDIVQTSLGHPRFLYVSVKLNRPRGRRQKGYKSDLMNMLRVCPRVLGVRFHDLHGDFKRFPGLYENLEKPRLSYYHSAHLLKHRTAMQSLQELALTLVYSRKNLKGILSRQRLPRLRELTLYLNCAPTRKLKKGAVGAPSPLRLKLDDLGLFDLTDLRTLRLKRGENGRRTPGMVVLGVDDARRFGCLSRLVELDIDIPIMFGEPNDFARDALLAALPDTLSALSWCGEVFYRDEAESWKASSWISAPRRQGRHEAVDDIDAEQAENTASMLPSALRKLSPMTFDDIVPLGKAQIPISEIVVVANGEPPDFGTADSVLPFPGVRRLVIEHRNARPSDHESSTFGDSFGTLLVGLENLEHLTIGSRSPWSDGCVRRRVDELNVEFELPPPPSLAHLRSIALQVKSWTAEFFLSLRHAPVLEKLSLRDGEGKQKILDSVFVRGIQQSSIHTLIARDCLGWSLVLQVLCECNKLREFCVREKSLPRDSVRSALALHAKKLAVNTSSTSIRTGMRRHAVNSDFLAHRMQTMLSGPKTWRCVNGEESSIST